MGLLILQNKNCNCSARNEQDLGEREARDPVPLLDGVDPDVSVSVYVRMEDLCEEANLWRPEGVEHRNLSTICFQLPIIRKSG